MLTIIIAIFIIALIAALAGGFLCLRKKIRKMSHALFGTEHLLDGIEKANLENASRPKSIAAMTRLVLPRITADFPDFSYPEMKNRAENLLTSYLRAIHEKNRSLLTEESTEIREQLSHHLAQNESHGETEHMEQIRIHQTEISEYRKEKGRCIITFQSSLESYHYFTGSASEIVRGSKELKEQSRYALELIYIQNRDLVENEAEKALGMNCPNCGAPLSSLGAKVCEYCGSPVLELNIHAWTFSKIYSI